VMREPTEKSASAKSMRNEVLQKDIRAVFCSHLPNVVVICESAVWFDR
jgi:hypothetical protein